MTEKKDRKDEQTATKPTEARPERSLQVDDLETGDDAEVKGGAIAMNSTIWGPDSGGRGGTST